MKTATQTTVSRSATAMEMLKANIRAYEQSKPLPYTKEQFSNPENEDFCAEHIRYWNNALPRAEQFTKHEHSEGCENHEIGCRVLEKTSWNQEDTIISNASCTTNNASASVYGRYRSAC